MTRLHDGLYIDIKQHSPILLDASFDCAPRELLALVGPSGSGKSTLLRAIAGLFKTHHSDIMVGGEIWSSRDGVHVPTHKRRVGMVFQSYALFPHMTVLNNIKAAIDQYDSNKRNRLALDLLSKVNLSGFESRKPRELSGGQQQRVAVARALAREPKVLLLDEPFTAVDKLTRRRLYREIIYLRRELEIPVVLVTHDLDEAAMLADRMVVLHRGKTLQSGTPDEITTRPANAELAKLVDIRNVFDAKIGNRDPNKDQTQIIWSGCTLDVVPGDNIPQSKKVKWAIPDGSVVIQRTDRPSSRRAENTIEATVKDVLFAGQYAQVSLIPVHDDSVLLYASVPRRIIHLNAIAPDSIIKVSLPARDIHIMPN